VKSAPLHPLESERLQNLRNYSILDTPSETRFEQLTQLAAYICQTPVALISLVDNQRQWFKAKIGLDLDETPRDMGFCSHTILDFELMEISDTLSDERFKDNPLVLEYPSIRFYAGAPLISPQGLPMGALCVIDTVPRILTEDQRKMLRDLASQVIDQMELRLKVYELEESHEKLHFAQEIITKQRNLQVLQSKRQLNFEIAHGILENLNNADLLNDHYAMFFADLNTKFEPAQTREVFDLHETVSAAMAISRGPREIRKIKMETSVLPKTMIKGGRPQVSQVLLRLLINSLSVFETSKIENKLISVEVRNKGHFVDLLYSDNRNLSEGERKDIFTPEEKTNGLYKAKNMMLAIGGDLVHLDHPLLTKFLITLPTE
jgi:hypothetical protein